MRPSLLAVIVCCCAASAARAGGAERVAVVAVSGDQSPADAATVEPVLTELGKRGFESGTALAADIDARVSHDGGALSASQVVEAQKDVDDAYQRFIDGDYPRALAAAQAALQLYATAPGQLSREPVLRELRYKALIVAARSSEINGAGEDAFALMAEAIRSFPDRAINAAQFDPSVNALYRRVREELGKQGAGSLTVKADDPAATIFVDEQFMGSGEAKLEHVPPGRYRVYVSKGQVVGRVREIDVAPKSVVSISVPWSLDGVLRTTKASATLALDPDASGDAEVQEALRLGHALGARTIVVLSVRSINGRRAVAGYSITVESQTRAFAAVQVEPVSPSPETLGKLAALLAGDKGAASPGMITVEPVELEADEHPAPPLGPRRTAAIVGGGVAVVALAVAGGFDVSSRDTYSQSKMEPDDAKQRSLYNSANTKYKAAQGLAIGGGVVAVAAAILWFTGAPADESTESRGITIAPSLSPDGFAFVAAGTF